MFSFSNTYLATILKEYKRNGNLQGLNFGLTISRITEGEIFIGAPDGNHTPTSYPLFSHHPNPDPWLQGMILLFTAFRGHQRSHPVTITWYFCLQINLGWRGPSKLTLNSQSRVILPSGLWPWLVLVECNQIQRQNASWSFRCRSVNGNERRSLAFHPILPTNCFKMCRQTTAMMKWKANETN